MKKIVIFLVLSSVVGYSQNKQILYDFAGLPQYLMLNPGAQTNYKYHIGVPLASGLFADVGSSNLVLSNLFLKDKANFNDKFIAVLNKLSEKDHLKINAQLEILNAGFRLNSKTYLSFGFYQEFDAISYYPKDVAIFVNEGNASYLNRSFSLSQLLFKADLIGVLHAGISREMTENFTIGARLKIYSGSINARTSGNTGTFTTRLGENNTYTHYLTNINVNIETSGITNKGKVFENETKLITDTFLDGNLGIGFDVGFTYNVSKQLEISASILDMGFIHQTNSVLNYKADGNFTFEGVNFLYDATNSTDYWSEISTAFTAEFPSEKNVDRYISWRPTKLNGAIKYNFGKRRSRECYDNTYKDFYINAIGMHLFTVFRPLNPQLALTGFYEKAVTKKLFMKLTYTVDEYSFYNIGVGVSAQVGPVNMYGTVGNLLEYANLADANNVSAQFGFNLIFN